MLQSGRAYATPGGDIDTWDANISGVRVDHVTRKKRKRAGGPCPRLCIPSFASVVVIVIAVWGFRFANDTYRCRFRSYFGLPYRTETRLVSISNTINSGMSLWLSNATNSVVSTDCSPGILGSIRRDWTRRESVETLNPSVEKGESRTWSGEGGEEPAVGPRI